MMELEKGSGDESTERLTPPKQEKVKMLSHYVFALNILVSNGTCSWLYDRILYAEEAKILLFLPLYPVFKHPALQWV
jgi:hypothetical protein